MLQRLWMLRKFPKALKLRMVLVLKPPMENIQREKMLKRKNSQKSEREKEATKREKKELKEDQQLKKERNKKEKNK